jgi:hypothetical protein
MSKDKKNKRSEHVEVVLINDIGDRQQAPTSISINHLYQHFSKGVCITTTKTPHLSQKIE